MLIRENELIAVLDEAQEVSAPITKLASVGTESEETDQEKDLPEHLNCFSLAPST
jgi:hypothetical protein